MTNVEPKPDQPTRTMFDEIDAQFMSAELQQTRAKIENLGKKFENLQTFYMTVLAAFLSAAVLLLASGQPIFTQVLALGVLGSGAWIFSMVLFTRSCITRSLLVLELAGERRQQEYFLSTSGDRIRRYTPVTIGVDVSPRTWQRIVFSPPSVFLFVVWVLLIALLAAAACITLLMVLFMSLMLSLWSNTSFYWGWYLTTGIVSFGISLTSCLLILGFYRRKAEGYARKTMASFQ